MCFSSTDPNSPWKYHFTTVGEDTLRCENANNVCMWEPPIINLGPYWRLLATQHFDRVNGRRLLIEDTDLEYHWKTTREETIKKCVEELKA